VKKKHISRKSNDPPFREDALKNEVEYSLNQQSNVSAQSGNEADS
jgi:hypothetical protein